MGRRDYLLWGLILYTIKYNLDRFVALIGFDRTWMPWSYLLGTASAGQHPPGPTDVALGMILVSLSLPFVICGVMMTMRRLRDVGWPVWLVVLFFEPFINLVFFLLLCLEPPRANPEAAAKAESVWQGRLLVDQPVVAALLGILASSLLGLVLTVFGTVYLKNYGWGLFVGIPFMMGFSGSLIYSLPKMRGLAECLLVAGLAVGMVAMGLFLLAIEGFVCLVMAAPIALVLSVFGAIAGYAVQRERWSRRMGQVRLYAAAWVLLPLLLTTEAADSRPTPLIAAVTTCEIDAPPEKVWRHVVSFGELPPPRENIFLLGIAYPVRARLQGQGVGAVRHCEFSTGPFVEPITVWDEPHRLAFDVRQQPHPMREWSPYAEIHPAHLEGFFRSRRGEFRLSALPGGRTRLEGTTWYEQSIWPQAYWKPWSDYLIHTIHRRVLEHIKAETERDPT
jgi:uncharacterized membrane protein YhaH (DUF805 family)